MSRKKAKGITKGEILDAGLKLVLAKGPDVTVQEIANAASVSRQMVYQYFGTRGGMLIALVNRLDEEYGVKKDFYRAMKTEGPKARLSGCLKVWLNYVNKILPIASDFNRLRHADPDAAAAWDDRMSDLHSWMKDLVATFEDEQSLKAQWSVADATDFMIATASFQLWEILTVDRNWSNRKTTKTIAQYLCDSLLKQSKQTT